MKVAASKNAYFLAGTVIIIGALLLLSRMLALPAKRTAAPANAPTAASPGAMSEPSTAENTPAAPIYTPSRQIGGTQGSTTYSSPSPSYTVINYYGEMFSRGGWKIIRETTLNGTTTITAQNNGQSATVAISDAADNGTTFTLS